MKTISSQGNASIIDNGDIGTFYRTDGGTSSSPVLISTSGPITTVIVDPSDSSHKYIVLDAAGYSLNSDLYIAAQGSDVIVSVSYTAVPITASWFDGTTGTKTIPAQEVHHFKFVNGWAKIN